MKKKIIKIISSLVILIAVLMLSSCGAFQNKSVTMPHGVDITVPDDWKAHFLYPESVPSLHFGYDNINVLKSSTQDHYTFVKNDFRLISDAWADYLMTFKDGNYVITKATKQMNEVVSARLGGEYLPLDELIEDPNNPGIYIKQECSMEYLFVGFTDDGTRYSCNFRTFVSEGKRYYGYAYTGNLEIKLNMPVMVIKDNHGEKKLVLLPLPFDTKYKVSNNQRLDAILKRDSYMDEENYIFEYPTTYDKDHYILENNNSSTNEEKQEYSQEEKVTFVEQWYIKYCNGKYEEGMLYVEYAGARFRVNFDAGKETPAFSLTYVGAAIKD